VVTDHCNASAASALVFCPRQLSGRVGGEECLVAVEQLESPSAAYLRRYSLSIVR